MKKRRAVQTDDDPRLSVARLRLTEIYGGMIPGRAREADAGLPALAASIAKHGLLQPILVRPSGGRYALVCGARRLQACRMLGLKAVDAVIFDGDERDAACCYVEEHAAHLPPPFLDEAALLADAEPERRCALPEAEIARRLRMLALDEGTRQAVRGLALAQAEPLLLVPEGDKQREAASIIAQRGLTAAQARRLVAPLPKAQAEAAGKRRAVRHALAAVHALCAQLTAQGMNARVSVLSQERGICVQLLLKNPETSACGQEKGGAERIE